MLCLLVEDERQTREGMLTLMPWHELGFDVVLTATNGIEALSVLEHEQPDLIISDVRMPRMNGAQLIKEVRERGLGMPFLFISGFSDKEYLMAAIRYHAADYVEKPVMISELTERVRAIVRAQNTSVSWVTARSLLDEGAAPPARFARAHRYYVALLVLSADGVPLTHQQVDGQLRAFHNMAIYEEEAPARTLIVAGEAAKPIDFAGLITALNYAGGGYALCVSRPVSDFARLREAYAQADACASRAYMGPLRGLHVYEPASPKLAALSAAAGEDMRRLCERRLYPMLPWAARARIGELRRLPAMRRDALEVLKALAAPLDGLDWRAVEEGRDFDAAAAELMRQLDAWVARALSSGLNPATARALSYIAGNLEKPLSVSELAQAAFVSASHLSFLFRGDMGVSLKQYVNDMRMETARLLLRSGCTVQAAAAQVGIRDVNYFSKLFKRDCGVPPSDFH